MKIQIIQHSAADSSAAIGEILDHFGHRVSTLRIDRGDAIPSDIDADALMMFGGAAPLDGTDRPAWVGQEIALIKRYVDQGGRVMGICLGSQLLAMALGAEVRLNSQPEVGWHLVSRMSAAPTTGVAAHLPATMTAFQWHQNTFGIPDGAKRLYESDACANQAFVLDDRVFGFQFHFEANERTVRTFIAVSKMWQQKSEAVQTKEEMLSDLSPRLTEQRKHLQKFLRAFCPPELA